MLVWVAWLDILVLAKNPLIIETPTMTIKCTLSAGYANEHQPVQTLEEGFLMLK